MVLGLTEAIRPTWTWRLVLGAMTAFVLLNFLFLLFLLLNDPRERSLLVVFATLFLAALVTIFFNITTTKIWISETFIASITLLGGRQSLAAADIDKYSYFGGKGITTIAFYPRAANARKMVLPFTILSKHNKNKCREFIRNNGLKPQGVDLSKLHLIAPALAIAPIALIVAGLLVFALHRR